MEDDDMNTSSNRIARLYMGFRETATSFPNAVFWTGSSVIVLFCTNYATKFIGQIPSSFIDLLIEHFWGFDVDTFRIDIKTPKKSFSTLDETKHI